MEDIFFYKKRIFVHIISLALALCNFLDHNRSVASSVYSFAQVSEDVESKHKAFLQRNAKQDYAILYNNYRNASAHTLYYPDSSEENFDYNTVVQKNGSYSTNYPGNVKTTKYYDGSIEKHYPDKTVNTVRLDGRSIVTLDDGSQVELLKDGTSVTTLSDGTKATLYSSGSYIMEKIDGSKTTSSNGVIITIFPNGIVVREKLNDDNNIDKNQSANSTSVVEETNRSVSSHANWKEPFTFSVYPSSRFLHGKQPICIKFTAPVIKIGQNFGEAILNQNYLFMILDSSPNSYVAGKGKWLTDTLYCFEPMRKWQHDLTVTIQMNPKIINSYGEKIDYEKVDKEYTFTTSTLQFYIASVESEWADDLLGEKWNGLLLSNDDNKIISSYEVPHDAKIKILFSHKISFRYFSEGEELDNRRICVIRKDQPKQRNNLLNYTISKCPSALDRDYGDAAFNEEYSRLPITAEALEEYQQLLNTTHVESYEKKYFNDYQGIIEIFEDQGHEEDYADLTNCLLFHFNENIQSNVMYEMKFTEPFFTSLFSGSYSKTTTNNNPGYISSHLLNIRTITGIRDFKFEQKHSTSENLYNRQALFIPHGLESKYLNEFEKSIKIRCKGEKRLIKFLLLQQDVTTVFIASEFLPGKTYTVEITENANVKDKFQKTLQSCNLTFQMRKLAYNLFTLSSLTYFAANPYSYMINNNDFTFNSIYRHENEVSNQNLSFSNNKSESKNKTVKLFITPIKDVFFVNGEFNKHIAALLAGTGYNPLNFDENEAILKTQKTVEIDFLQSFPNSAGAELAILTLKNCLANQMYLYQTVEIRKEMDSQNNKIMSPIVKSNLLSFTSVSVTYIAISDAYTGEVMLTIDVVDSINLKSIKDAKIKVYKAPVIIDSHNVSLQEVSIGCPCFTDENGNAVIKLKEVANNLESNSTTKLFFVLDMTHTYKKEVFISNMFASSLLNRGTTYNAFTNKGKKLFGTTNKYLTNEDVQLTYGTDRLMYFPGDVMYVSGYATAVGLKACQLTMPTTEVLHNNLNLFDYTQVCLLHEALNTNPENIQVIFLFKWKNEIKVDSTQFNSDIASERRAAEVTTSRSFNTSYSLISPRSVFVPASEASLPRKLDDDYKHIRLIKNKNILCKIKIVELSNVGSFSFPLEVPDNAALEYIEKPKIVLYLKNTNAVSNEEIQSMENECVLPNMFYSSLSSSSSETQNINTTFLKWNAIIPLIKNEKKILINAPDIPNISISCNMTTLVKPNSSIKSDCFVKDFNNVGIPFIKTNINIYLPQYIYNEYGRTESDLISLNANSEINETILTESIDAFTDRNGKFSLCIRLVDLENKREAIFKRTNVTDTSKTPKFDRTKIINMDLMVGEKIIFSYKTTGLFYETPIKYEYIYVTYSPYFIENIRFSSQFILNVLEKPYVTVKKFSTLQSSLLKKKLFPPFVPLNLISYNTEEEKREVVEVSYFILRVNNAQKIKPFYFKSINKHKNKHNCDDNTSSDPNCVYNDGMYNSFECPPHIVKYHNFDGAFDLAGTLTRSNDTYTVYKQCHNKYNINWNNLLQPIEKNDVDNERCMFSLKENSQYLFVTQMKTSSKGVNVLQHNYGLIEKEEESPKDKENTSGLALKCKVIQTDRYVLDSNRIRANIETNKDLYHLKEKVQLTFVNPYHKESPIVPIFSRYRAEMKNHEHTLRASLVWNVIPPKIVKVDICAADARKEVLTVSAGEVPATCGGICTLSFFLQCKMSDNPLPIIELLRRKPFGLGHSHTETNDIPINILFQELGPMIVAESLKIKVHVNPLMLTNLPSKSIVSYRKFNETSFPLKIDTFNEKYQRTRTFNRNERVTMVVDIDLSSSALDLSQYSFVAEITYVVINAKLFNLKPAPLLDATDSLLNSGHENTQFEGYSSIEDIASSAAYKKVSDIYYRRMFDDDYVSFLKWITLPHEARQANDKYKDRLLKSNREFYNHFYDRISASPPQSASQNEYYTYSHTFPGFKYPSRKMFANIRGTTSNEIPSYTCDEDEEEKLLLTDKQNYPYFDTIDRRTYNFFVKKLPFKKDKSSVSFEKFYTNVYVPNGTARPKLHGITSFMMPRKVLGEYLIRTYVTIKANKNINIINETVRGNDTNTIVDMQTRKAKIIANRVLEMSNGKYANFTLRNIFPSKLFFLSKDEIIKSNKLFKVNLSMPHILRMNDTGLMKVKISVDKELFELDKPYYVYIKLINSKYIELYSAFTKDGNGTFKLNTSLNSITAGYREVVYVNETTKEIPILFLATSEAGEGFVELGLYKVINRTTNLNYMLAHNYIMNSTEVVLVETVKHSFIIESNIPKFNIVYTTIVGRTDDNISDSNSAEKLKDYDGRHRQNIPIAVPYNYKDLDNNEEECDVYLENITNNINQNSKCAKEIERKKQCNQVREVLYVPNPNEKVGELNIKASTGYLSSLLTLIENFETTYVTNHTAKKSSNPYNIRSDKYIAIAAADHLLNIAYNYTHVATNKITKAFKNFIESYIPPEDKAYLGFLPLTWSAMQEKVNETYKMDLQLTLFAIHVAKILKLLPPEKLNKLINESVIKYLNKEIATYEETKILNLPKNTTFIDYIGISKLISIRYALDTLNELNVDNKDYEQILSIGSMVKYVFGSDSSKCSEKASSLEPYVFALLLILQAQDSPHKYFYLINDCINYIFSLVRSYGNIAYISAPADIKTETISPLPDISHYLFVKLWFVTQKIYNVKSFRSTRNLKNFNVINKIALYVLEEATNIEDLNAVEKSEDMFSADMPSSIKFVYIVAMMSFLDVYDRQLASVTPSDNSTCNMQAKVRFNTNALLLNQVFNNTNKGYVVDQSFSWKIFLPENNSKLAYESSCNPSDQCFLTIPEITSPFSIPSNNKLQIEIDSNSYRKIAVSLLLKFSANTYKLFDIKKNVEIKKTVSKFDRATESCGLSSNIVYITVSDFVCVTLSLKFNQHLRSITVIDTVSFDQQILLPHTMFNDVKGKIVISNRNCKTKKIRPSEIQFFCRTFSNALSSEGESPITKITYMIHTKREGAYSLPHTFAYVPTEPSMFGINKRAEPAVIVAEDNQISTEELKFKSNIYLAFVSDVNAIS